MLLYTSTATSLMPLTKNNNVALLFIFISSPFCFLFHRKFMSVYVEGSLSFITHSEKENYVVVTVTVENYYYYLNFSLPCLSVSVCVCTFYGKFIFRFLSSFHDGNFWEKAIKKPTCDMGTLRCSKWSMRRYGCSNSWKVLLLTKLNKISMTFVSF